MLVPKKTKFKKFQKGKFLNAVAFNKINFKYGQIGLKSCTSSPQPMESCRIGAGHNANKDRSRQGLQLERCDPQTGSGRPGNASFLVTVAGMPL